MLKAFILSYIGNSINAGFWYCAAAFILVTFEIIAGERTLSKYHARRTKTSDGVWHDSAKEAKRWDELRLLHRAGAIQDLRRQVRYEVIPKQEGERAVYYVADFVYKENGKEVVEDCKGYRTDVYKLKRKLMMLVYGITILET